MTVDASHMNSLFVFYHTLCSIKIDTQAQPYDAHEYGVNEREENKLHAGTTS